MSKDNNISDKTLLQACEIYMQINGWTRLQLIEEFKQLAEQVAPMRFDDLVSEVDHVINHG